MNFVAIQNTESDFAVPWWYRKEFALPPNAAGRRVWINFQGINYRANIWLNAKRIADQTTVAGTFRQYEFDITSQVNAGGLNVLALEIFRPVHPSDPGGDLAMTPVDWNPQPPDLSMGLLNDVFITTSGPVAVRSPLVTSRLDLPSLDAAHLSVSAERKNSSDTSQRGILEGTIGTITFSQEVRLAAGEVREVGFSSDDFPQLNIAQPHLWWPWQYGEPFLYLLWPIVLPSLFHCRKSGVCLECTSSA